VVNTLPEEIEKIGSVSQHRYEQIVAELREVVEQQTRGSFTIGDRALDLFTDRTSLDNRYGLGRFIDYMSATAFSVAGHRSSEQRRNRPTVRVIAPAHVCRFETRRALR
jgi:hypothetical protein